MWTQGAIGIKDENGKMVSISYWVKHYEEGSQFGIDGGRISKLMIKRSGEIVCNYDRGWDVEAVDEDTEFALAILLKTFN